MKRIILVILIVLTAGCDPAEILPTETETFDVGDKFVEDCSNAANEGCVALGYDRAIDYSCRTVKMNRGTPYEYDQDILYSITCIR